MLYTLRYYFLRPCNTLKQCENVIIHQILETKRSQLDDKKLENYFVFFLKKCNFMRSHFVELSFSLKTLHNVMENISMIFSGNK